MQQTENYKLNLIETSDPFSPTPLNENTRAIDAALLRFTCGTYTGNGSSKGAAKFIELPFTPKLVYVCADDGAVYYYASGSGSNQRGGLAMTGKPVTAPSGNLMEIKEGGFQVYYHSAYISANTSGNTYRYFAIG